MRSLISPMACVLVVAGVGLGFSEIGGPGHNRLVSLDESRIAAMETIADDFIDETHLRYTLPEPKPYEVSDAGRNQISYVRTGARTYRLCTTFALPSGDDGEERESPRYPAHPAGPVCYLYGFALFDAAQGRVVEALVHEAEA